LGLHVQMSARLWSGSSPGSAWGLPFMKPFKLKRPLPPPITDEMRRKSLEVRRNNGYDRRMAKALRIAERLNNLGPMEAVRFKNVRAWRRFKTLIGKGYLNKWDFIYCKVGAKIFSVLVRRKQEGEVPPWEEEWLKKKAKKA